MFEARLRTLREELGLTQAETAEKLDVSLATYGAWEQGRRKPGYEELDRICKLFLTSADWLMYGTDTGHFGGAQPQLVWIPHYNVELGAGPAFALDNSQIQQYRAFEQDYIRAHGLDKTKLSVCKVRGDSMAPRIHDGDLVLVDHRPLSAYVDDIYAIRYGNNEGVIKTLQFLPGNRVKVISENRKYDPFELDLADAGDDFAIIGRAVWHGGDL